MMSAALLLVLFVLKSSTDAILVNRTALAQIYQVPQQSYSNYLYFPYSPDLHYSYILCPHICLASPNMDLSYIRPPVTTLPQSSSWLTMLPPDLFFTFQQNNNQTMRLQFLKMLTVSVTNVLLPLYQWSM